MNLLLLLSFSTRKHTSVASRVILSNFFEEQWIQNHPQYLSGLQLALFPTTFLQNSCMRRLSKATLHHSLKRVSTLLIIKILYLSSNKISRSCSIKEFKEFKEFCFETTNFKRLLNSAFLLCEEISRRLLSFSYNILLDPHDSSHHKKIEFNNCYIIHLIYFELLNHLVDFL